MRRNTRLVVLSVMLLGLSAAVSTVSIPAQAADKLDRTVLPIVEPKRPVITEFDARKATAPPRFEVKAPAGAPNVLLVMLDDMGFGMSGAFGGPFTRADGRATRRQWLALQPFPYNGALFADSCCVAERP